MVLSETLDERRVRVPVDTDYSEVRHAVTGRKLYTEYGPHSNFVDDSGNLRRAQRDVTIEHEDGHTVAIARDARYITRFSDLAWPVAWQRREDGKTFCARPAFVTAFDELTPAAVIAGKLCDAGPWTFNTNTRELEGAFGPDNDVRVRFYLSHGGPGTRHRLYRSLRERVPAGWYGTVWEVSDPEAAEMLTVGGSDADVQYWTDGKWVIEYVRADAWDVADGLQAPYVEHAYTTVGGNLTADTVWTAGTYYVTSGITQGNYNLTLDATGGYIYVKIADGGTINVFTTDNGDLTTSGTTRSKRIVVTSENDDTRGEVIAGSSGSPAAKDFKGVVSTSTVVASNVDISYMEVHYGTLRQNSAMFVWQGSSLKTVTLDHIWVYNSDAETSATQAGQVIYTFFNANPAVGTFTASNIYVDSTCGVGSNTVGINCFTMLGTVTSSLTNAYFAPDASGTAASRAVRVGSNTYAGAVSSTITNVVVDYSGGSLQYAFYSDDGAGAMAVTINRCITKDQDVGSEHVRAIGANLTMVCNDCIMTGDGTATAYRQSTSASLTLNNCGDWSVSARTSGTVTDNNPIANKDPLFTTLPPGVELDPEFVIPEGFSPGNHLQYRYLGSVDYETAGLDPAVWSATGYRDLRVDPITGGVQYKTTGTALPTGGPEDEGDVLIFQTTDDGEIEIENGLVTMTPGLDNAVYLSLFGGNEEDPGGDDRTQEWWGNLIEIDPTRQYRSETQHLLRAIPAVTANLRRIEDAARRDLAWVIPAGVASVVEVAATMPALNKVQIDVTINGNETLTYLENWQASV